MNNHERRTRDIIKLIKEWDNVEYKLVSLPNNDYDIGFNIKTPNGDGESISYDPEISRLFSKIIYHDNINQIIASLSDHVTKHVVITKTER